MDPETKEHEVDIPEDNELRIRSAPPNPQAGRRLLTSRSGSRTPRRRLLHSRNQTRARSSRGNYQRSYSPTSSKRPHQVLVSTSIVRTPGYTLTRTPSTVRMNINTTSFFGGGGSQDNEAKRKISKQSSARASPTASTVMRTAMLEQATKAQQALEIEIAELNIRMEDLKQDHEERENQKEEEFQQATKEIIKQHQMEIRKLELEHCEEMDNVKDKHSEVVRAIQYEHEDEKGRYEDRLLKAEEKLQQSSVESEKALQSLEEDLKEAHGRELELLEEKLKIEMERKMDEVRTDMTMKHREEVEETAAQHKKEVDILTAKFNEAKSVEEDLKKSIKRNKKLEKELSKQKEKVLAAKSQQIRAEATLLETKKKIEMFEASFQQKVEQVECSYKDRLDDLMTENTQLRRRLLQKTDHFCEYRSKIEKLQAEVVHSTKEKVQIVVKARKKASLSIAVGSSDFDTPPYLGSKGRPSSAPLTNLERRRAKFQTEIR